MSKVQTISKPQGNSVTFFSVATIIMMMLYIMPQTVLFFRNDMMAIVVTIYYALFVSKYVSPAIILKTLLIGLPYILIYWFNNFPGDAIHGFILPFMTLWTLVMPCFATIAVAKRNQIAEQRFILIVTGGCLLYVFINSFQALANDPVIMREMTNYENLYIKTNRMHGVGGYGFAYAIGALFIAMCGVNRYVKNNKLLKSIVLAMIVACGLMIVQSQYATLLFISFFGVAIMYYLDAKKTSDKITIIVVAIAGILLLQPLLKIAGSLVGGEVLQFKFSIINDALWGGEGAENISGERSQMQLDAYGLFLKSPLWGTAGAVNMEEYYASHSTILGTMAATGLIGIMCYFLVFFFSCKHVISNIFVNIREKKLYYPVLIFYFLFAWLNPIEYAFECGWMIFFVIPLTYKVSRIR